MTRYAIAACIGILLPNAKALSSPADFDVLMRMVALHAPSPASSVAISEDQLKILLGHTDLFQPNDSFFVELWVSDVGALNTGVTGFFADLAFDNTVLRTDALFHTPGSFSFLPNGMTNNNAGTILNFGGNDATLSGQGNAPVWARVGYVQMFALGPGTAIIDSALGTGGIGVFGRLPPSTSQISFDTISLMVPEPSFALFTIIVIVTQRRRRTRSRGRAHSLK